MMATSAPYSTCVKKTLRSVFPNFVNRFAVYFLSNHKLNNYVSGFSASLSGSGLNFVEFIILLPSGVLDLIGKYDLVFPLKTTAISVYLPHKMLPLVFNAMS